MATGLCGGCRENFMHSEENATENEEKGSLLCGGQKFGDTVDYGNMGNRTPVSGSWRSAKDFPGQRLEMPPGCRLLQTGRREETEVS